MINTFLSSFLSSFSDVFISILALLSQIFNLRYHVRHMRMAYTQDFFKLQLNQYIPLMYNHTPHFKGTVHLAIFNSNNMAKLSNKNKKNYDVVEKRAKVLEHFL